MEIIGTDSDGNVYAIQRGLLASTIYRARRPRAGLGDVSDMGLDWDTFFQGINSNPIVQGIGAKIAGHGQTVPIAQIQPVQASGPGFFGSVSPMLLLLAGGGLILVLAMKR